MAMSDYEKSKFRFSETFNNADGKTSGSGFIGVISSLVAIICFLGAVVGWLLGIPGVDIILTQAILLFTIGGGLLASRKVVGGIQGKRNVPPEN